jgi:hypothetical protein
MTRTNTRPLCLRSPNMDIPGLYSGLSFSDTVTFIDLVCCLRPTIDLLQPSYHTAPPQTLPAYIHDFLRACLHIPDDIAKAAWITLGELAWNVETGDHSPVHHMKYVRMFLEHGYCRGICKWVIH